MKPIERGYEQTGVNFGIHSTAVSSGDVSVHTNRLLNATGINIQNQHIRVRRRFNQTACGSAWRDGAEVQCLAPDQYPHVDNRRWVGIFDDNQNARLQSWHSGKQPDHEERNCRDATNDDELDIAGHDLRERYRGAGLFVLVFAIGHLEAGTRGLNETSRCTAPTPRIYHPAS